MEINPDTITYPRRRVIRRVLKSLIQAAFGALSDFKVIGQENLPGEGPLMVIGNHFSFLDPVAMIGSMPYPMEFIGGSQMPNAPTAVWWIARMYGTLPVRRGSVSRDTLKASQKVLQQGGVLGVFPEAGSWATVLRPARPGAAFLASATQARILPVGFDGLTQFFPRLRRGKRPQVTLRVGKPFGPFFVSERGESDRKRLTEIGNEMMRRIAKLIPVELRGHYSDDPAVRRAANETDKYPWDDNPEV
jgi:1-acyl-sn-glycerol-3-phosphate acyltransferase